MNISPEFERNLWAANLKHCVSGTDKVERELWAQVCGKPRPSAQHSVQLQSNWQKLQASLNRQRLLEEKLFSQVAASGFQPE